MPGPEDLSTQEVAPSPFTPREPVPDVITTAAALGEYAERLRAATGPLALDAERASGFKYSQRAYLVQSACTHRDFLTPNLPVDSSGVSA